VNRFDGLDEMRLITDSEGDIAPRLEIFLDAGYPDMYVSHLL
jgi:hypothetical protein